MSQAEQEQVNIVLIGINIVSLILNVILILITIKTPNRSKDINVILILAVVDMLLPIDAIIAGISNFMGESDGTRLMPCTVKGPIDFSLLIISVMLVSVTAIQRYTRVLSIKIPSGLWIGFFGYSLCYLLLVFVTALMGEFSVSSGGVDCTPDSKDSVFSTLVLTLLGFNFLLFLAITLFCYIRIMVYATSVLGGQVESIELKQINSSSSRSRSKRRTILIRTLLMATIYFILLAPPGILIMLEANSLLPKAESYSLAISIFTSSISLANPILVLFVHAVIYGQLIKTLTS